MKNSGNKLLGIVKYLLIFLCCALLIFAGKKLKTYLEENGPEAPKKERMEVFPKVKVITVNRSDVPLKISSEGMVGVRRETRLATEVGGRVIEVDSRFENGGGFQKGEVILRVDQSDYATAVALGESALADARLNLKVEETRAGQAARDWEKLGRGGTPSEMVLRVPHIASAKAKVKSAEASLAKAKRDLERTVLRAPYDCRVRVAGIDLGAIATPGAIIGEIYEASDYEVRLPVSMADLGFLKKDATVNYRATVGGRELVWKGKVVRREGDINRETLSAYVITDIESLEEAPEGFHLPPPGMFLKATLEGEVLEDVVVLSRSVLSRKNSVLVVDKKNQLGFRNVEILRSSVDEVYLKGGLDTGDRVILTRMDLPIEGMKVEVVTGGDEKKGEEETEGKSEE